MQLLPYLNTKMLKTVTANVRRSNYDRKVSAEIQNVVKDSGEGRFFFIAGWCEEAMKKVVLELLARALGVAAFLHNVIIGHPRFSIVAGCFFMHYNATLCN
jgi:hypothetical protein